MPALPGGIERLIDLALEEDLGLGDVTSEATIPAEATGRGTFLSKDELVLAGTAVARRVFERLGATCRFDREDGAPARRGDLLGVAEGPVRALLAAERTSLNFLQRLSGVATTTRRAVDALAAGGGRTRLLDTRKTTPGWRRLEKDAVRAGGGVNHRFSLGDGILIKDNHAAAVGSVGEAVRRAKASVGHLWKIEAEVKSLTEYREAIAAGADVILLDNMTDEEMASCVRERPAGLLLEASGNMSLERLPKVAALGVDLISMGALTHSARACDISLELESVRR